MAEISTYETTLYQCGICTKEESAQNSVFCEGCDKSYCRKPCWRHHWCGGFTDYHGKLVKVGDVLEYRDNPKRVYEVTEIPSTYANYGWCFGLPIGRRKSEDHKLLIKPRLMQLRVVE